MTIRVSHRRVELLLTTAIVAAIAIPAVGAINPFPVLNSAAGASGGAIVPSSPTGNTEEIKLPGSPSKTAINWDSFDIQAGNEVKFTSTNTTTALGVLNRVIGS